MKNKSLFIPALHIGFAAFISIFFISCTKNQLSNNNFGTTVNNEPAITSKIFKKTNDPFYIEFGTGAIINSGTKVAIYLPYGINKDILKTATITLTSNTEEILGNFNLVPSTDASAATLNIPYDLWYVPFMFAVVNIDNTYTGKSVNIRTHLAGQAAVSDDVFADAFIVQ